MNIQFSFHSRSLLVRLLDETPGLTGTTSVSIGNITVLNEFGNKPLVIWITL